MIKKIKIGGIIIVGIITLFGSVMVIGDLIGRSIIDLIDQIVENEDY